VDSGAVRHGPHAHARDWKRPRDFVRTPWDEDALLGETTRWGSPFAAPGLTASDRRLLERAASKARTEIRSLGRSRRTYGLIHADLHYGNTMFQGTRLAAIDFDDCAEGWFLYDILVAAGAFLFHRDDYRRRMAWFLRAYGEHSPFDEDHLELMEAFLMARRYIHLGWITSRADNPRLAQYVDRSREHTLAVARTYLER
jgi:Ser/Thr protein kinase RdoA (MazF antagonist)